MRVAPLPDPGLTFDRTTATAGREIGSDVAVATPLTCDHLVTYLGGVSDDDIVFKALADPTRRFLLDLLFARDGRTLTELESELDMTRFGVMKHLRVLEEANLVVTRRSGREKLHFLNPVPIRLVHDRWIDKFTERRITALVDLKHQLESEEKP
jgi:DNA-binding transcriptional ArsR family regulator